MGCAQLSLVPPVATIEACVAALERQDRRSNSREAANVAWALATLEACDLPTWERLMAVVAREGATLADVAYAQLAQAHLLMQLRYGHSVPCPPQLLQRSQAAWQALLFGRQREQQQLLQGRAVSRLEFLLAAAVAQLAGSHAVEAGHIVHSGRGEPLLQVDIALPQLRIAVEADGPVHFIRNKMGRDGQPLLNGPTGARNRLLRHHGWHVVEVPFWVCNAAMGTGAPQAALLAHLQQHTDLAAAIAERAAAASSGTK
ncbi:Tbc2 translation chloroplastic [Chlorella sorokiniana]|uniref:Tbc2 translation chloroplastic n=1 Tax=Chlorella sorokiniana TaxID=3076 RepID=A0A2P6TJB0_CHLSO|nr:Tbc2 translation chloroplastic [Chlorella sorokiniana]|eukprot:PRW39331.1 Tbc2 translation chloroplastic [Chlorella sorokiniana]